MNIGFIACSSKKKNRPSPAGELYTSPLFKKSREFVEETCDFWFILSAKYGVVTPQTIVNPYDLTLSKMPISARRSWAELVKRQLTKLDHYLSEPHGNQYPLFVNYLILAGTKYRQPFESHVGGVDSVIIPMKGLGIGHQLQWLTKMNNGGYNAFS